MAKLSVEERNGITVMSLDGPLTSAGVENVQDGFLKVARRPGRRIVVDLAGVEMLSTPAIAMFVQAINTQRASGGRVVFTRTNGAIDKLLHICRLDLIMKIVHDPADAMAQAGQ